MFLFSYSVSLRCSVFCLCVMCTVLLYCVFCLCVMCTVLLYCVFCLCVMCPVLLYSVFCLCVNVYCTAATGISGHFPSTLTEGFPYFFLSFKANARV
jgi:hypothetical protein